MKPGIWSSNEKEEEYLRSLDLFVRGCMLTLSVVIVAAYTPLGFEVASSAFGF